jgi:hypothetical protein
MAQRHPGPPRRSTDQRSQLPHDVRGHGYHRHQQVGQRGERKRSNRQHTQTRGDCAGYSLGGAVRQCAARNAGAYPALFAAGSRAIALESTPRRVGVRLVPDGGGDAHELWPTELQPWPEARRRRPPAAYTGAKGGGQQDRDCAGAKHTRPYDLISVFLWICHP